jgi:hypothetical protein
MLHNVSNLPAGRRVTKSRKLISAIAHTQTDAIMMTEMGLPWRKLDNRDRWYERVREAFQSTRSSLANNLNEPKQTTVPQYGGVGVMVVNDMTHRIVSQGTDPTNLGRWSWVRLEGKQEHHLRIVSVYRPVDSVGPGTVYSQHERHFSKIGRTTNPREAIYEDLFDAITSWKALGDHIIVGIDANEDVRTGQTKDLFRSLDMHESILRAHADKSPPATCDKNTNREPIDGIFVTSGIRVIAGGYAAFNEGCPSDHRYLWIDVSYNDAFGMDSPSLVSPVRRFNTRHPKNVQKYNQQVNGLKVVWVGR